MTMHHAIKTLKYLKGPDLTVGLCACDHFEVTVAGNQLDQARGHLELHLRRHGVGSVREDA